MTLVFVFRDRYGSRDRGGRGGRDGRDGRDSRDTRENVSSEVMSLEAAEIAYLLGRNGATKQRLANFSGARLEIDPRGDDGGRIEVIGTPEERELARLCVDITLQQRNAGRVNVDIDKLEARSDVSQLDVPKEAVGFVLVSFPCLLSSLCLFLFIYFAYDAAEAQLSTFTLAD